MSTNIDVRLCIIHCGNVSGSSVGVTITYPLCGFILNHLPWEAVFYVTGTLGTIWFISWWIIVYDSPAQHPRITQQELKYIQDSLGPSLASKKVLFCNQNTNYSIIAGVLRNNYQLECQFSIVIFILDCVVMQHSRLCVAFKLKNSHSIITVQYFF